MCEVTTENYNVDYPVFDGRHLEKDETTLARFRREISNTSYGKNRSKQGAPYGCNYYQRPYLYFWADGDYLKCLGTGIKIKCEVGEDIDLQVADQKVLHSMYGLSPAQYYVLKDLHSYLYYQEFTDYYKALMSFKWKAGLRQFPLFDQYDHLKVVDGKLWGLVWDDKQNTDIWKLLTEQIAAREIKRWHGKDVRANTLNAEDKKKFDKAAGRLVRLAIKYHSEVQRDNEDKPEFEVPFVWGTVRYVPVLNQMEITYTKIGWPWDQHIPQNPALSSEAEDSLRTLTAGNMEVLDNIAELATRLYLPERPSKYLWVVLGEFSDIQRFIQWIAMIANLSGDTIGTAIYHAPEKERNLHLFYDQCSGCRVQINERSLDRDAFKKIHAVLKKYVAGDVMGEFNDPYIPNGTVRGKGVIIYTSREQRFDAPKDIPYKVIRVPKGWRFPENSHVDAYWLQSCLLALGYQIIVHGGFGSRKENQTVDGMLEQFTEEFCNPEKGSWIDRKKFYETFEKYCRVCHHMEDKFPSQKDLFARVRTLMGWEEKEVRQNNNRISFLNVLLNEEQVEKALLEAENSAQNTEDIAFDTYLGNFSELLAQPKREKPKVRIVHE